ncbi:transmembrane protein 171 [Ambystoma mexicanum]|uniref:transmembrane protein 171 n=1 Tax=Ambystoma mexicanum TaxID=8296 RepID=UPI0037E8900D
MYPFSIPVCFGGSSTGHSSKFIFVLFVFGVVLFCAGLLLSIFGFQACQAESFSDCSMTLKVLGPSLAAVGLGSILIAKSRARLHLQQRQLQGEQVDVDRFFLCGENNQFAQFLIFGFLFLTSGVLISVLGMWVPGCTTSSPQQQRNNTSISDAEHRSCGFLSLQIMGPLIVLVGLCFFVVAHIKKKHVMGPNDEGSIEEEQQTHSSEPFQITVGGAVVLFPPPPPPYFADPFSEGSINRNNCLPSRENPPSYNSIYSSRSHVRSSGGTEDESPESVYSISRSGPTEIVPSLYFSSDPPPKYEEKEETVDLPVQAPSPEPASPDAATPRTNLMAA